MKPNVPDPERTTPETRGLKKVGDILSRLCAKERANTPFDRMTVDEIIGASGTSISADYPNTVDLNDIPFASEEAIRPIETLYGPRFYRSRLEAKWAVFFDDMQFVFEYEPEGFTLADGSQYLPDFWLPQFGWFVEVKPTITGLALGAHGRKADRFARQSKRNVLVLDGEPDYRAYVGFSTFLMDGVETFEHLEYSLDVYWFGHQKEKRFWACPDYSKMRLPGTEPSSCFSAEYIGSVHSALTARFTR